jgi:hypothetical protein
MSAILSLCQPIVFYQPFNVVSAILYCVSPFTYFVTHSMFRAAILYYVSHFRVVSAISCFASHFNVLSAFDFVTAILMFCQIFYIDCQSFLVTSFFWLCVLQVYYLDNLLSNISVRAGTPLCQFFTSDVIDRISNLD